MYMFKSLRYHLGGGFDHDYIDQEHVVCDFPHGLMQKVSLMEQNVNHMRVKGTYFDYCA